MAPDRELTCDQRRRSQADAAQADLCPRFPSLFPADLTHTHMQQQRHSHRRVHGQSACSAQQARLYHSGRRACALSESRNSAFPAPNHRHYKLPAGAGAREWIQRRDVLPPSQGELPGYQAAAAGKQELKDGTETQVVRVDALNQLSRKASERSAPDSWQVIQVARDRQSCCRALDFA